MWFCVSYSIMCVCKYACLTASLLAYKMGSICII